MRNKTFIIAELSANHNNDYDLAKRTIQAMAHSGADAVKIQTYTANSLAIDVDNEFFGPKKDGLWKGIRPYDLYREGAMPYEWQPELKKFAEEQGLIFFSSPFDFQGVDFLESLNVPLYKIASFEINDIPLIRYVAQKGKPMIISTGVGDIEDIELALETCYKENNRDISLLKCTSQYPASPEDANLLTITDMASRFKVKVGVSDHTMGDLVPTTAVALGAQIVEKHFILDRSMGGPDSPFSMEPQEFKTMVERIRETEKVMGKVSYDVAEKDKLKRRSIFVIKDVKIGEVATKENIGSRRPGNSLAPKYWDEIEGLTFSVNKKKGDKLDLSDLL